MIVYSIPRIPNCAILLPVLCAVIGCSDPKPEKESYFLKLLTADPRIEVISVEGDYEDYALYHVHTVSFSIRGKPNSRITLVPLGDSNLDPLRILEIGSISPLMMERDHVGWVNPRSPTLGNDSKYRPPLPWKNIDLSGLVTHYDELLDYFSKWPKGPDFKTITTDGGIEVRCSISPADDSTMRQFIPPSTSSLRLKDRNDTNEGKGKVPGKVKVPGTDS